jgi:hypothetical protein
MYTDLTNKLNTGIKSRFTGFDVPNEIGVPAADETKLSWVGSAIKNLVRALDRVGSHGAVDESLFGLHAYLAGDLAPGPMAQEARRVARAAYRVTPESLIEAKAYGHYDYFDLMADYGYFGPAIAQAAKPMGARRETFKTAA